MQVEINEETLQDIINIETGLLAPLDGFMREEDFRSVVGQYSMADGQVFTSLLHWMCQRGYIKICR